MNKPSDFHTQLAELTVELCGIIAEKLAYATKDLDTQERAKILSMIENNLPDIVSNSIAKSPSLHSAQGVDYLHRNLKNYADSMINKIVGKI